ncbi:hypothetical protein LXL04_033168 [Taraxacum kok-saghyz]
MSILERVLVSDHWLHIQFTQVQLRTLKSKKEIGVLAMESISKFSSGRLNQDDSLMIAGYMNLHWHIAAKLGTCANFITCLSIVSSISCRRMNLTYMKIEYKKEANSFK